MDAWTVAIDLLTISIILNIFIICGNRQKDRELQEYQHRAHMAEYRLERSQVQLDKLMSDIYDKETDKGEEDEGEESDDDDLDEFSESQDDDDCIRN